MMYTIKVVLSLRAPYNQSNVPDAYRSRDVTLFAYSSTSNSDVRDEARRFIEMNEQVMSSMKQHATVHITAHEMLHVDQLMNTI